MRERIQHIMNSKDPCGQELEKKDTRMGEKLSMLIIVTTIFAFIIALIISLLFAEAHDSSRYSIVTLFGLNFEIDNDNFFISPFMVFCYIFIILEVSFYLISLIISALIISIQANVAKKNLLNNTYRTAQLLELIASSMKGDDQQTQQHDPASQSPEARANEQGSLRDNVHMPTPAPDLNPNPAVDTSGQISCPRCQASQYSGRVSCYKCGYEFPNNQVSKVKSTSAGSTSDRIFCPSCGTEQNRNQRACFNCGREFKFQ